MTEPICLFLRRKSANREDVKSAVKNVKKLGKKVRVRIAWNKKDKHSCVVDALNAEPHRIIAGDGFAVAPFADLEDGMLNLAILGAYG